VSEQVFHTFRTPSLRGKLEPMVQRVMNPFGDCARSVMPE